MNSRMSVPARVPTSVRGLRALLAIAPAVVSIACSESLAQVETAELESLERGRSVYADKTLFVEPGGNAERQADEWRTSYPEGAAIMDQLAQVPVATWIGDYTPDPQGVVASQMDRAGDQLNVFVVYNIPERDCGNFSSGGAQNPDEYAAFIGEIAAGLAGRLAIVVLEPDGLALDDCLEGEQLAERHQMIGDAVDTLTAAGAAVYIDAGDSNWIPAEEMAGRLLAAGVDRAAGFALNVSHTEFTEDEIGYAKEIRAIIGKDAHYVIDTGRNGLGPSPDNEWCNPLGRANGREPTLRVGNFGLDALLWIKPPGESDGNCNGGPDAGHWWPEYALDLALQAGYTP